MHRLCTAVPKALHSHAFPTACQGRMAGAQFDCRRRRRGAGEGNLKGDQRRRDQSSSSPGRPGQQGTRALGQRRSETGRPGAGGPKGDTFNAGPTRTWVRGRGPGQLGCRPLSRFGLCFLVTPAKRPLGRAEPGPDGPRPSWKSSWNRRVRPRIDPPGRPGGRYRRSFDTSLDRDSTGCLATGLA